MSGQVYQRGKVWYIDYYTGKINAKGKNQRIKQAVYVKSKSEAKIILAREFAKNAIKQNNCYALNNNCAIEELFNLWCKFLQQSNNKPLSIHTSIKQVQLLIESFYNHGIVKIDSINLAQADLIVQEYIDNQLSHSSINRRFQKLKLMFNYGVERNVIVNNPLLNFKSLKTKRVKFRRALSDDEVKSLLAVSNTFKTIWKTFLTTGLRASELINLPIKHVDLKAKVFRIAPYKTLTLKTKSAIRSIPIHSSIYKEIIELCKNGQEYVFTNSNGRRHRIENLLRTYRRDIYKAMCTAKSLTSGKRLNKVEISQKGREEIRDELKQLDIHGLRYTFCTNLIKNGVDVKTVQTLMGHSSPAVTLEIYSQYCGENAKEAVLNLSYL